jgi:hypothetical protein
MSRNLIIAIIVVIGITILSTFVYMHGSNTKKSVVQVTPVPTKTPSEDAVSSIKDVLAGNKSVVCQFKDDSGYEVKGYIKDGMVREDIVASTSAKSGSMVIRDKKMYFWNDKNAIVMNLPDEDAKDVKEVTDQISSDPNQAIEQLDKFKKDCKYTSVEDKVFVLPTNVKFQDISIIQRSMPFISTSPVISKP